MNFAGIIFGLNICLNVFVFFFVIILIVIDIGNSINGICFFCFNIFGLNNYLELVGFFCGFVFLGIFGIIIN